MSPHPADLPPSRISRSSVGFVLTFAAGVLLLGGLALWFFGSLVVAASVLLLLLSLGADSRLAGWLASCSALAVLHALRAHPGSPAGVVGWFVGAAALALCSALVMGAVARSRGVVRRPVG